MTNKLKQNRAQFRGVAYRWILRLRSAFFAFRASAEILRLLSKREILSYAMYGRAKAKIPC